MSDTTRTCPCTVQQYEAIIFGNVGNQANANTIYQSLILAVGSGPKQFKSDYERMQFLLGRQNQAGCGVPKKAFALGTN
uniref:Uncharacterized protein n=1 Tax=viral metagenome TaxID=1070528 RepID=A0A6C0KAG0_9ZZZZ